MTDFPKQLLLLTLCATLAGCQSIKTRLTAPTTASDRLLVCKAWKPATLESYDAELDTPETVAAVRSGNDEDRANNAARKGWGCK